MKALILSLCALISTTLLAQVQGPLSPQKIIITSLPGSNATWKNVEFASGSDDKYASFGDIPGGGGVHTDYLVAGNFGFNLAPGAIILGIVVNIERSDPNEKTSDFSVRIVKGGTISTTERAAGMDYAKSDAYLTYGSSSDMWGESWTDKNIMDDRFGVAISASRNSGGGITAGQIDDIQITVYYYFATLPVNLLTFSAAKNSNKVNLDWTTSQESNMDRYDVERSSDGRNFTAIGSVASHTGIASSHYTYVDNSPLSSVAYYRLKMFSTSGFEKYSKIVSVLLGGNNTMDIYPNPLNEGDILHINNPGKESLSLRFFDMAGKMVLTLTTSSDQIAPELLKIKRGTYVYRVSNSLNQTTGSGQIVIK